MRFLALILCFFSLLGCSKKDDGDNSDPGKLPYAVIQGSNGLKYHTGLLQVAPEQKGFGAPHVLLSNCDNMPAAFDLRTIGVVPDVRDQGQCGSCWSFSKTGSLESALLGQGKKMDLSMQDLVSCDKEQYGCNGGFLSDFKYQISHGQSLASDYPYTSGRTGNTGACKKTDVAANGASFQYVGTASRGPTVDELKCALYTYKTVPWITVGATNAWGNPPSSEKTPYTSCGSSQTNHAVGVVGWWTDSKGKTQFIMKNSWGKEWGDAGYMSLPLGCNNFGEEVAFIEIAKPTPPPTPTPNPSPSPTPQPSPTPSPTPPGPCSAPKVKMAAEVQVFGNTEVMLGVKSEANTSYSWVSDGAVVGNESMLFVTPEKDAVYKLSAKNECATAESQVRVRIVMSVTQ